MMTEVRKQQLKQKYCQCEGSWKGNDVSLQKGGKKKHSSAGYRSALSCFCQTVLPINRKSGLKIIVCLKIKNQKNSQKLVSAKWVFSGFCSLSLLMIQLK